jgi:hypothetical protein
VDYQLIALYEIKRQTFLNGFIQNPDRFSSALAYAYYNRIAPIFHETSAHEAYGRVDPFEEIYAVKRDFVDKVTKYVDERWRAKDFEAIAFYSLEDKFGGKGSRVELIGTLEYARINRLFDDAVWKAIDSNAPVEAHGLESTFTPKDVEFS